jgi:hypothetical protein
LAFRASNIYWRRAIFLCLLGVFCHVFAFEKEADMTTDQREDALRLAKEAGLETNMWEEQTRIKLERLIALARAKDAVPDGMVTVMVPREPTPEMLLDGALNHEPSLEEALDLLDTFYALYEDGPGCYEEPDECGGYMGNAIKLEDGMEDRVIALLEKHRPRAMLAARPVVAAPQEPK